jgi:predicted flap endonuclease-1-like 5' DNA nuclease
LWWFVFGLLLGWLLNWLLAKSLRRAPPLPERASVDAPASAPRSSSADLAAVLAVTKPPPFAASVPPPTASSRVIDVGAARAAGFNLKHADDLTIIEGIGPKIDELFRTHGVTGFAQFARLGVADMLAILDQGGPHFRLANPTAWAHQALLASENRWGELKALQEELINRSGPADNH